MQRYELLAWLGDDHGLDTDQLTELLHTADESRSSTPTRTTATTARPPSPSPTA